MKRLLVSFLLLTVTWSGVLRAAQETASREIELSDLSYEKNIDVKCNIVTFQQLGEYFSRKDKSMTQLSSKVLIQYGMSVYFLIRVKNTGHLPASGMLHCFVPNCGYPFPVKVMEMPPHMEEYYDYILQFDSGLINREDKAPEITYKWHAINISQSNRGQ